MIPGLITPVLLHQEQLPIPPAFRHPMPGNDDLWCPVELRSACKLLLMRAGENICVCVFIMRSWPPHWQNPARVLLTMLEQCPCFRSLV